MAPTVYFWTKKPIPDEAKQYLISLERKYYGEDTKVGSFAILLYHWRNDADYANFLKLKAYTYYVLPAGNHANWRN